MMKMLEYFLVSMIVAGALVLPGCEANPNSPLHQSILQNPPTTQAAGGSASASTLGPSFQQVGTLPAGKAVVYIYRPIVQKGFADSWNMNSDVGIPLDVKINGKVVTTLVQGGYYTYIADPGNMQVTAVRKEYIPLSESPEVSITVNIVAGQAYYLKGSHGKGVAAIMRMVLVSPEVGANEIANCKSITTLK